MVNRSTVRIIWGLLLAVGVAESPALAQDVVSSSNQSAAVTAARWTPARKQAAQPRSLVEVTGTPVGAVAGTGGTRGTLGGWTGHGPGGVSTQVNGGGQTPAIGAGSTTWYPYPPPSNLQVPIIDYFVFPGYPITTMGKLFFQDGAQGFVCSGASITSAGAWGAGNRQTVMTAGHCCSDGAGTFFSDWVFEPAHVNGSAPLGSWTAANASVFTAWHTGADLTRDECVLQMNTDGGQNINDAVGALGYKYDLPLPQHYHAAGWPAAAPFPGGILTIVTASDAETDTLQAGSLPFTHGIGNIMTGGSSGGPWMVDYQPGIGLTETFGPVFWNGLNSYKYISPARPNEMFGPYIDFTVFDVLLQFAATKPPAP